MDGTSVLIFLGGLQDVRELLSALARYCTCDGLNALGSALGFGKAIRALENEEVTSNMLLIANLCSHQDFANATFYHLDPVTDVGQIALCCIGATLLHNASLDERQLTVGLAVSTVQNVLAARHLSLVALQASITPSNCFRIFRFAYHCGIMPLRQAAEQVCLANLPNGETVTRDKEGFILLDQDQLESILQSDALEVTDELEVFRAIATWAHARPQERVQLMATLVQRCVRLGAMDLSQLEQLDQEPLVVASQEVTRVVARMYVMRIMGMRLETAMRPRDGAAAVAKAIGGEALATQAEVGPWATRDSGLFSSSSIESMVWAH